MLTLQFVPYSDIAYLDEDKLDTIINGTEAEKIQLLKDFLTEVKIPELEAEETELQSQLTDIQGKLTLYNNYVNQ